MATATEKLVFKFDGAGVNSAAFGRDFLPLVVDVYSLVQACAEDEVRVLSIENNCIKVVLLAAAAVCGVLLGDSSAGVKDVAKYNVAARGITSALKRHGSTMELWASEGGTVRRFDGETGFPSIPEVHREVKTTLAIYGELLDVGGANPNVHIRSEAFPSDVVLDVGREEARRLAQRLYSQVGVHAAVTIRDGAVFSGKVLDIIDYAPEAMDEWLRRGGGVPGIAAFKDVDVARFIAEQRV
jgi:hypothetical protein